MRKYILLPVILLSFAPLSCVGKNGSEEIWIPVIRYNPVTYLSDIECALTDPESCECLSADSQRLPGIDKEILAYSGEQNTFIVSLKDDGAEPAPEFITKMYNEKLYEDYDFLQKHCSPELLEKLQDAYPYDSDEPQYATWLFRSGMQDSKPGSDGKTMMLDVKADGDWYLYTALDMGWEFTNRIKVTCSDGKIIIEDMDLTAE